MPYLEDGSGEYSQGEDGEERRREAEGQWLSSEAAPFLVRFYSPAPNDGGKGKGESKN